MARDFKELNNREKSYLIKKILKKNKESEFLINSVKEYTYNFFEAIEKLQGEEDIGFYASNISLDDFIKKYVSQKTITLLIKNSKDMNTQQYEYLKKVKNIHKDYFALLYSTPLKNAYENYCFLYK